MSCLNINIPCNENVNINFGNSHAPFISGQSGQITGNQNYSIGLAPHQLMNTNRINISSGAAPYSGNVILNSGAFDGGLLKFVLEFPDSINPLINFIDQSSNNVLAAVSGQVTGFNTYLEFSSLNNNWYLNNWV